MGKTNIKEFIQALLIEASQVLPNFPPITTLYFGGGTPSMLSNTHLKTLIDGLRPWINFDELDEFSFESNPATFTKNKVAEWRQLGINRVSLGIQSWDPNMLKLLGREHSPQQAAESLHILREEGIPQVNVDLMFSLPGQSLDVWQKTLETTLQHQPNHISAYNLTYEEDTAFFQQLQAGLQKNTDDEDAAFFLLSHDLLSSAGYRHYETSNFALQGCVSKHNQGYWLGHEYVGLGPSAVSTIARQRRSNTQQTSLYIEALLAHKVPPHSIETLSDDEWLTERIALLLRMDTGLPLALIPKNNHRLIPSLEEEGLATLNTQNELILTRKGILLTDEIACTLLE